MPATGPDRTRRALLAGALATCLHAADPAADVWESVTEMAAALARGSDVGFLAVCDSKMAGYSALRANIAALVAAADVESGIDPVSNTGDEQARDVEVDWQISMVDRSGLQRVTRRRQVVKCRFEKRGRKWKVATLDPVAFFAPPSPGPQK